MDYTLILIDTAEAVDRVQWPLQLPAVVGRGRDADIVVNHSTVSRRHCQFALNADGALVVRDLDSFNGTYVGDQRVRESEVLMPGDYIKLGGVTLRVVWTDERAADMEDSSYEVDATQPFRILHFDHSDDIANRPPQTSEGSAASSGEGE
ncbi:MAG: FHA domain-containing protein [Pirellulales bacterium]